MAVGATLASAAQIASAIAQLKTAQAHLAYAAVNATAARLMHGDNREFQDGRVEREFRRAAAALGFVVARRQTEPEQPDHAVARFSAALKSAWRGETSEHPIIEHARAE